MVRLFLGKLTRKVRDQLVYRLLDVRDITDHLGRLTGLCNSIALGNPVRR